jgi:hypothetical protein
MMVLKQDMKPTQVHGIYQTKEQHLQENIDWLMKDPEARDWLYSYWASDQFRAMSEWNQQNQMSKESMHHYGVDGHVVKMQRMVRKAHNFNSQLLRN